MVRDESLRAALQAVPPSQQAVWVQGDEVRLTAPGGSLKMPLVQYISVPELANSQLLWFEDCAPRSTHEFFGDTGLVSGVVEWGLASTRTGAASKMTICGNY